MSNKRMIDTKFWDDSYISNLDPIEKLLFLYFLTNPITNLIGVYEISLKRIGFDTGLDKEMVQKILNRFTKDKKIYYFESYIIIRNFIKHQINSSKDIQKGIKRTFESLPETVRKFIAESAIYPTQSNDTPETVHTPSHESLGHSIDDATNSNSISTILNLTNNQQQKKTLHLDADCLTDEERFVSELMAFGFVDCNKTIDEVGLKACLFYWNTYLQKEISGNKRINNPPGFIRSKLLSEAKSYFENHLKKKEIELQKEKNKILADEAARISKENECREIFAAFTPEDKYLFFLDQSEHCKEAFEVFKSENSKKLQIKFSELAQKVKDAGDIEFEDVKCMLNIETLKSFCSNSKKIAVNE